MAIYHGGGWEGGYGPRPRIDCHELAKRLTIGAFAQAGASDDFLAQVQRDLEAIKQGTNLPLNETAQAMLDALNDAMGR